MLYRMTATVVSEVEEEVDIEIEADNEDEAADIAYDILDDPERSSFVAERYHVRYRFYGPRTVTSLEDLEEEDAGED